MIEERDGVVTMQGSALTLLGPALAVGGRAPEFTAVDRACDFLRSMGRMKYLKPLYKTLASRDDTRERARALFAEVRDTYHPIAQMVVEGALG